MRIITIFVMFASYCNDAIKIASTKVEKQINTYTSVMCATRSSIISSTVPIDVINKKHKLMTCIAASIHKL